MNGEDIVAIVIACIVSVPLIIMSVFLLKGRGAFLIAGYNTLPKSEQAKYDSKAMCKFVGKILLPIGILTPLLPVGLMLGFGWAGIVFAVVVVGLVVFALVYLNTKNRFRK